MSEKEIAELFEDIQDDLEKLQGTGETFMFFTEKKNRGVISGSINSLTYIVMYNYGKYEIFKQIVDRAISIYNSLPQEKKDIIKAMTPTHEIVNQD